MPYSTCESLASSVVHVIVAPDAVMDAAATADMTGGAVSPVTVAVALATSVKVLLGKNRNVYDPLVAGIVKASLKALRFIHKEREATIATAMKFAGLDKNLATRMYDDLVGTFTQNGIVDEETQRNDIEVIRQITKTAETIPIQRTYDFRFAREADRQLTQSDWRP